MRNQRKKEKATKDEKRLQKANTKIPLREVVAVVAEAEAEGEAAAAIVTK